MIELLILSAVGAADDVTLVVAGVFPFEEGLKLVAARGRAVEGEHTHVRAARGSGQRA